MSRMVRESSTVNIVLLIEKVPYRRRLGANSEEFDAVEERQTRIPKLEDETGDPPRRLCRERDLEASARPADSIDLALVAMRIGDGARLRAFPRPKFEPWTGAVRHKRRA
jgi:hypothetical protein